MARMTEAPDSGVAQKGLSLDPGVVDPVGMPDDKNTPSVHKLEALAKELGPADADALRAILAGHDEQDLVKLGSGIHTSRIVTDVARLYGEANQFWSQASEQQKKTLKGFSRPLLALAVQQALSLEMLLEQRQSTEQQEGAQAAISEEDARQTSSQGVTLRDQAYTALRESAGRQGTHRAELDAIVGTAETPDALASGLEGLATLLQRWLKEGGDLALRLSLASLDEAYAQELSGAARGIRASAAATRRRPASNKVTQSQLDREDGASLVLLGQIIRAFERAHDLDPTIPRLVPIATRRLFSRRASRKATEGTPTPPGS